MTDTNAPERPERIWAHDAAPGDSGGIYVPWPTDGTPYIRADLATPAPREDGYSAGVRAAIEDEGRRLQMQIMQMQDRTRDSGPREYERLADAAFRRLSDTILALLDAPTPPDARAGAVEPVATPVCPICKGHSRFDECSCHYAAPPTPACTATDGPASACVYRAPGLGTAATFEKG